MIKTLETTANLNYVRVEWRRPKFEPMYYKLSYSCKLKHDVTDYISKKFILIDSNEFTYKIRSVFPDSLCKLTLHAVYNLASVDSGITTTGMTISSGKEIVYI